MMMGGSTAPIVMRVGSISLSTGLLFGLLIGLTPNVLELQSEYRVCEHRSTLGEERCLELPWCRYDATALLCAPLRHDCGQRQTEAECSALEPFPVSVNAPVNAESASRARALQPCQWYTGKVAADGGGHRHVSADGGVCSVPGKWTAVDTAWVASLPTIGGLIGSLACIRVAPVDQLDALKRALGLSVAAIVVVFVAWRPLGNPWYSGILIGQCLQGISTGALGALVPSIVATYTPQGAKTLVGTFFQVALTFGIALAAVCAVALHPLRSGVEGILGCSLGTVVGAIVLLQRHTPKLLLSNPAGAAADNPPISVGSKPMAATPPPSGTSHVANVSGVAGVLQLVRLYPAAAFAGLLLAASNQLTGINAIMNFAPRMCVAAGIDAALGTMVVMAWNFICTVAALPLIARFAPRRLYMATLLAASVANVVVALGLVSGVAPGVKLFCFIVGVFGYIGAFEFGIGPLFFVLAIEVFPPHLRSVGCSMTNVLSYASNLVVTFFFPMVVSMGTREDPDMGMRYCFWFFAVFGVACVVGLNRLL